MGILQEIKNDIDGLIDAMVAYVRKFNDDKEGKKVTRMTFLSVIRRDNAKLTEFFNQANTSERRGGLATLAASSASLISSAKERVHLQGVMSLGIRVKKIKLRAKKISTYTQNDKNTKGRGWNGHQQFLSTEMKKIMLLVHALKETKEYVEQACRDRGGVGESKYSKEETDKMLQEILRRQRRREQSQHRKDQEQPLIERSQGKQNSSCLSSCCLCLFSNKAPSTKGYHQMDDVAGDSNGSPESLW